MERELNFEYAELMFNNQLEQNAGNYGSLMNECENSMFRDYEVLRGHYSLDRIFIRMDVLQNKWNIRLNNSLLQPNKIEYLRRFDVDRNLLYEFDICLQELRKCKNIIHKMQTDKFYHVSHTIRKAVREESLKKAVNADLLFTSYPIWTNNCSIFLLYILLSMNCSPSIDIPLDDLEYIQSKFHHRLEHKFLIRRINGWGFHVENEENELVS